MNKNIDLTKILKNCPVGWKFWSPLLGDVKFHDINQEESFINIILENGETWNINADGTISLGITTSPEIMLFPSRVQRDWSKFTAPLIKKKRFNPKTLKPFDKVLVRDDFNHTWNCDMFSYHEKEKECLFPFHCIGRIAKFCIPYNDDTSHLVGTTDEAPEFYKYWED